MRSFEVSSRGRDVLIYQEGDLRVSMLAELQGEGPHCRSLCPRDMRVHRPGESLDGPGTPLTDEGLRDRIIAAFPRLRDVDPSLLQIYFLIPVFVRVDGGRNTALRRC